MKRSSGRGSSSRQSGVARGRVGGPRRGSLAGRRRHASRGSCPARRIPSRRGGLFKRLAASGAAYQASSLLAAAAGALHAAALHAPPDARRLRLRRDAADGDHPRLDPAAPRHRRGARALLVRRRRRGAPRRAWRGRSPAFVLVASTRRRARGARAGRAAVASCCSARATPTLMRLGVLGLWAFTNLEVAYALLRVEERRRAYLAASLANVLLTVALTVTLVVGLDEGARGYVLGNYAASTVVLSGCGSDRCAGASACRPARGPRSAPLLRFGAPTVPADATVFALNVVDRAYLLRAERPRRPASTPCPSSSPRSSSSRCAAFRPRGRRWPTRSTDDAAGRAPVRARHDVPTSLVTGLVVAALTLLGRWLVRLLAADGLRRRARGAAVGRAGLGAVRPVPRLRDDRRARQGHDAHVPRRRRRPRRSTSWRWSCSSSRSASRARASRCAPPTS